jgi:hypothetical protein
MHFQPGSFALGKEAALIKKYYMINSKRPRDPPVAKSTITRGYNVRYNNTFTAQVKSFHEAVSFLIVGSNFLIVVQIEPPRGLNDISRASAIIMVLRYNSFGC